LAELTSYRADFTRPLQVLCERLKWNFLLMSQIATEWQARNKTEEDMFGFDSSVIPTENLWLGEKGRREEWCLRMQMQYQEAWIGLLQDLRECLQPTPATAGKRNGGQEVPASHDSSTTNLKGSARQVTVRVKGFA
jgi:hypothetical protein